MQSDTLCEKIMKYLKAVAVISALIATVFFATMIRRPADLIISGHQNTWVDHYANISLQIVPRDGLALKKGAPLKVKVETTLNLSTAYPEIVATKKNFVQNIATFNILVKGEKKGPGLVTVTVTYFLCSDTVCQRFEDVIDHSIYVKKR